MTFTIREGTKDDCPLIIEMIKELAVYEKFPNAVEIDHTVLENDGFSDGHKYFYTFVAQSNDDPNLLMGYSLYFYKYSTWKGKYLWMEDLYVRPEYRRHGVGTRLWQSVAKRARNEGCQKLEFSVLNWNRSAIDFYQANGAVDLTHEQGLHLFRMDTPQIQSLAEKCVD